jgi:membrane protein
LPAIKTFPRIAIDAFVRFNADDGWAIASHIALSALMALFPFLLVLTAIASFLGSRSLADEGARIILEMWPEAVSASIALDIHDVLLSARTGALTLGVVLALYFASAGVEALRVGINRDYGTAEARPWWARRLESIGYGMIAAIGLIALSFLVFLAPLIWAALVKYLPQLAPFGAVVTFTRLAVAAAVLVVSLIVVHLWLPAGRRRLAEIAPGVIATLVLWLLAGTIFGRYLADFAFT